MRHTLQFLGLLLVSLLLHALWGLMPLRPLPPVDAPALPALRNLGQRSGESWSPVLFSLPSRIGFSSVLPQQRGIEPPLQSPVQLPVQLQPDLQLAMPSLAPAAWDLGGLAELPEELRPAPARPDIAPGALRWRLRVLEGEGEALQLYRLPPLSLQPGSSRIEATLHFNRYGQVESCILQDPASVGGEARSLLQALRRVRISAQNSEEPRVLRVALEKEFLR